MTVATDSRTTRREVLPHLEGLRGLAVLAVLLFHLDVPGTRGGFAGVDVFFVLSGFLITGLLIRERERTGRIDLRAFYARRARRILPAAIVTIVATVAAAAVLLPPLDVPPITLDGAACALSIGNIRFAIEATDYFGETTASPFRHYWSLGVEEQFYLLWPAFLIVAVRFLPGRARLSRRRIAVFVAAALLGSLLLEIATTVVSVPWAFYSLPTRAWQLALGGLLALSGAWFARRSSWLIAPLGLLGLAGVIVSFVVLDGSTAYPGVAALLPALAAGAVAVGGDRRPASIALGLAPVRWLGRISYSLYLWHWPILTLPVIALGRALDAPEAAALGVLSIAVGALSWRFIEEPFRRGWSPSLPQRRTLVAAVAAMVVTAVVSVGVGDAVLWRLDAMASEADSVSSTLATTEDGAGPDQVANVPAGPDDEVDPAILGSDVAGDGAVGGGSATDRAFASPGPSSGDGGAPKSAAASSEPPIAGPTSAAAAASPSLAPPAAPSAAPSAATPAAPSATPSAVPSATPTVPAGHVAVPLPRDVTPRLTSARDDSDPVVRDGCGLSIGGSVPPTCVYGRKDGAFSVALVGDSHAEHWFPALERLADERGWRLLPFTKHSCPFVDMRIYSNYLQREYTECEAWRPLVVAALQEAKPDLVVVASHRWFPTIVAGDGDPVRQGAAMARLLKQLPGQVVLLADTPISRFDVPACLSAHLRDITACATSRTFAFGANRAVREQTAAKLAGVPLIDLSDIICPGRVCPAVIDDMIVLRDDHHLTATFSASLADVIGDRLPPMP